MKNKTTKRKFALAAAVLMLMLCASAAAQGYDADTAESWFGSFCGALARFSPVNDPALTADPARAGQYLFAYEFGTVLARGTDTPSTDTILEIDVRTQQVTDCRGVRVGMPLDSALGGAQPGTSSTQLYVLSTQNDGWSWAYMGAQGVYGVEYITYGGSGAQMTEYTLTYVIDGGVVSAIRMKKTPATQAQAQEGLATAQEIASRQHGEVLALANGAQPFSMDDLQVMGAGALGVQVASLVARMGEPQEVQTLPEAAGRILVYDGAAVTLGFDEMTGVEIVRGVSVSSESISGPRGLRVGMSVQEAAALFRCDEDTTSLGGMLYMLGEAKGEPPCGELVCGRAGEITLSYACLTQDGETAALEAGIDGGGVAYWHLYYRRDAEGGV